MMPALRKSLPLILALAFLGQAASLRAEVRHPGVAGRVIGDSNPLSAAHIYAYQLADLTLHTALTDGQGAFLFQDLPAGLYKIIAHKAGFLPVVMSVTHTTAQAYQFLELQLSPRQGGQAANGDDFWAIRARVPADVLHQIEALEAGANSVRIAGLGSLGSYGSGQRINLPSSFKSQWLGLTGVDQIAAPGGGQMSGGDIGVQGQLGATAVDVRGRFFQLSPDGTYQPAGGSGAGSTG
ncbi:MAG TPA: carboxypeptidase-like regulatory domain-containing protein, partial [Thermoanaerobaculia bacterium]